MNTIGNLSVIIIGAIWTPITIAGMGLFRLTTNTEIIIRENSEQNAKSISYKTIGGNITIKTPIQLSNPQIMVLGGVTEGCCISMMTYLTKKVMFNGKKLGPQNLILPIYMIADNIWRKERC